jgi:hypothetical protein
VRTETIRSAATVMCSAQSLELSLESLDHLWITRKMLVTSVSQINGGGSRYCSPSLDVATRPHHGVAKLLHKSAAGENPSMYFALPLCLGSTRSFEALALGAAWGVGRPWRHRADLVPPQLGRGGWKTRVFGPFDLSWTVRNRSGRPP